MITDTEKLDLFKPSIEVDTYRDLMDFMSIPCVALSSSRKEKIIFKTEETKFDKKAKTRKTYLYEYEISSSNYGLATIADNDFIIYLVSLLNTHKNHNLKISQAISINAYQLLKGTHRSTSGRSYNLAAKSLQRLCNTKIKMTTFHDKKKAQVEEFSFIDRLIIPAKYHWDSQNSEYAVEPTKDKNWIIFLSSKIFDLVDRQKYIKKIDPVYFSLNSLEKYLYRYVVKAANDKKETSIGLKKLYVRSGLGCFYKFKHNVKKIAARSNRRDDLGFPNFTLTIEDKKNPNLKYKKKTGIGDKDQKFMKKSGRQQKITAAKKISKQPNKEADFNLSNLGQKPQTISTLINDEIPY